ncbi:MAG: GNAT family N-acetyltransferase [Pseudomonadota bacterium]
MIRWTHDLPSADAYVSLRQAAGLGKRSVEAAQVALPNTLYFEACWEADRLVGMGRAVGDGGCFVQLVDIAVAPTHQCQGIGRSITSRLVTWCKANLPATCHVSLVSSERAVALYQVHGFQLCRGLDRYASSDLCPPE